MRDGICPKCGSTKVYRRLQNAGAYTGNSLPMGGAMAMRYFPLDNYVCVQCGYVEFYLSYQAGLDAIAQTWERSMRRPDKPGRVVRARGLGRSARPGPLVVDLYPKRTED